MQSVYSFSAIPNATARFNEDFSTEIIPFTVFAEKPSSDKRTVNFCKTVGDNSRKSYPPSGGMICVSASLKYFLYVRSFVVGLTYKTSHSFNHSSYFNRNTSEIIFFAVLKSEKTAKIVPHKSGYPDALNGNCFLLKICYSVVIFVFLPSRFQTRVCLLRFQTISVLPAIMPGQANLSRNPEFP